jgi:hypothetical protein
MSVLDRLEDLLALAASPNENEARNAAWLAVKLIRKHRLVISLPPANARFRAKARSEPEIPAQARRRSQPNVPAAPRRRSPRSGKAMPDPPEKIVAPLGGECVVCGARYRGGSTIFWLPSGGGMHLHCLEQWSP